MSKRYEGGRLDNWGSPQYVFDYFNRAHHYEIDLAASPHNTKCGDYFTAEEDGLKQDIVGRRVWCNPPFGDIAPWVEMAALEEAQVFSLLLPVRTGMAWFERCLVARVDFLRGRLQFEPPPGYEGEVTSAPFDCMVVHFGWGVSHRIRQLDLRIHRRAA
jgi:phage N-6-adenine-methyltransferase